MTKAKPPENPASASPVFNHTMRRALYWVIRLTSGEATPAEIEAFRSWRDARPDHAKALAEARRYWLLLGHVEGGIVPELSPAVENRPRTADLCPPLSRRNPSRKSPRSRSLDATRKTRS